jgi:uncharacterized protein (DUF2461 family)
MGRSWKCRMALISLISVLLSVEVVQCANCTRDAAGGVWMPEASALAKLRRAIDRRPHILKQSLLGARLRKEYLGGVSADEARVAKALVAANQENALKTRPKVSRLKI